MSKFLCTVNMKREQFRMHKAACGTFSKMLLKVRENFDVENFPWRMKKCFVANFLSQIVMFAHFKGANLSQLVNAFSNILHD